MANGAMSIVLLLAGLALGCSETSTQGFSGKKRDRTNQDANNTSKLGDIQIEEEEDEQVLADEPVMVNGAFLTCAVDSGISTTTQQGIGCRVETESGAKIAISSDVKDTLEVLNAYNQPIKHEEQPVRNSRWHWHLLVEKVSLEGAQVQLDLIHQPTGHRRIKIAGISLKEVTEDELLIEDFNQFVSKMSPYHVGDNNYADNVNGYCEDEIESIGLSGRSITIPFTVLRYGTRIGVNLNGVCGVNRIGSYAVVKDAKGDVIHRVNFTINAENVAFPGFEAKAGEYLLELNSHKRQSDYDDYMVRKVIIRADYAITIGEVTSLKAPTKAEED